MYMNLKVKNSDFIEYIFLFGNDRNAFHVICVKSALKLRGLFCIFQDNDEPVAFITACNSENEILRTCLHRGCKE